MRKSQIIKAGSRMLAAGSIEDLDMSRVAHEVGFKPSSLRYYFKNKEDLAEAIFHNRIDELESCVERSASASDVQGFVRNLFESHLADYSKVLAGEGDRKAQIGEARTLQDARRKRIGTHFRELLAQVQAHLKSYGVAGPEHLPILPTQMLLEIIFWMPAYIHRFREWEFARVASDLAKLFCNGIAAGSAQFDRMLVEPKQADPDSESLDNDKFLVAATQLICQRGYRGTSIDAISAKLGVTKGSFYHHHPEKRDLVERCFQQSYDRISAFQRAAEKQFGEPLLAIRSVLSAVISAQTAQEEPIIRFSALPGLPGAIRISTIAGADPIDRWFVAQLARAHARGEAAPVDPYLAAQFMSVVANASYDTVWLYRPADPSICASAILQSIMHGFANEV